MDYSDNTKDKKTRTPSPIALSPSLPTWKGV